jgi:predicted nucleic-acid-binding Zn-ribbon protein
MEEPKLTNCPKCGLNDWSVQEDYFWNGSLNEDGEMDCWDNDGGVNEVRCNNCDYAIEYPEIQFNF